MKLFSRLLALGVLALVPLMTLAQATTDDATKAQIDKIQAELDTLKDQVTGPEGAIQTTVGDVGKLKKITFSGYAQLRLEDNRGTAVSNTTGGSGDPRLNFSQRRVRLKVVARPVDSTQVTFQWDMGDKGFVVKDALIEYFLKGDPTFGPALAMGQFAIPFGYQNTQSSSAMEGPERARVIKNLFPDEYDRGLRISSPTDGRIYGDIALLNGTGQNANDNTMSKDLVARLRTRITPQIEGGVSGYFGGRDFVPASGLSYNSKNRFGADLQLYFTGLTIKAEAITAKDKGLDKSGYYLLAAKSLTKQDTLVGMFDVYDDPSAKNVAKQVVGKQMTYTLGINHYLDANTKLRLFYEVDDESNNKYSNNVARLELLSTF